MYCAKLAKDDNGTFLVTFPDVPEAATFGDSREEALFHAQDALESALELYEERGEDFPKARYKSKFPVSPRALIAAKLELRKGGCTTVCVNAVLPRKRRNYGDQTRSSGRVVERD